MVESLEKNIKEEFLFYSHLTYLKIEILCNITTIFDILQKSGIFEVCCSVVKITTFPPCLPLQPLPTLRTNWSEIQTNLCNLS